MTVTPSSGPGLASGGDTDPLWIGWCGEVILRRSVCDVLSCVYSTLALFVAQVLADHHDHAVTADHLALVTDLLDARLYLHVSSPGHGAGQRPRAFSCGVLLVAVDDAASRQIVGRQLHDHPILRQDADIVLAHLAADVRENPMTVFQLDPKHRVGQWFHHPALDLDRPVLLGHVLRVPAHFTLPPAGGSAATRAPRIHDVRKASAGDALLSREACADTCKHAENQRSARADSTVYVAVTPSYKPAPYR